MSDPFSKIREFAGTLPEPHRVALEGLLADIDPADDGTPFGWGSQACAEEPWWARAEETLREAVVERRIEVAGDSDNTATLASRGFLYAGKNVNWMTREELLEEVGFKTMSDFYAQSPYAEDVPVWLRLVWAATDEQIIEIVRDCEGEGRDIEGLAMDLLEASGLDDSNGDEVIEATDALYDRISDSQRLVFNDEDKHVYEVT